MGSDESRFNVSVGSDGQSHKTASTNHNLFEEKGEPKRYRTEVLPLDQPNALPLGQTGSLLGPLFRLCYIGFSLSLRARVQSQSKTESSFSCLARLLDPGQGTGEPFF